MLAPCAHSIPFPQLPLFLKNISKTFKCNCNSFRQMWKHKKTNNLRIVDQGRSRSNLLQEQDRTVISLRSSVACMHACAYQKEEKCAALAPPDDSYGLLPVHRAAGERVFLTFPDFSQPSPLCPLPHHGRQQTETT